MKRLRCLIHLPPHLLYCQSYSSTGVSPTSTLVPDLDTSSVQTIFLSHLQDLKDGTLRTSAVWPQPTTTPRPTIPKPIPSTTCERRPVNYFTNKSAGTSPSATSVADISCRSFPESVHPSSSECDKPRHGPTDGLPVSWAAWTGIQPNGDQRCGDGFCISYWHVPP